MSCLLPGLLQGAWGKEGACQICVHAQWISHVRLFATPWTVPCQAPLSMGFSRQEYWSGLPFPSPELVNEMSLFFNLNLSTQG